MLIVTNEELSKAATEDSLKGVLESVGKTDWSRPVYRGAKRRRFHPVGDDMFIAQRTETLRRSSEGRKST